MRRNAPRVKSAQMFEDAFRSAPRLITETSDESASGLGFYEWETPNMEGFELSESDALIIALHLGGSDRVRAITPDGLTRSCSTPGLVTILTPGRPFAFRTEGHIRLVTLHVPRTVAGELWGELVSNHTNPNEGKFAFRDRFVSTGMEALMHAAADGRAGNDNYVSAVSTALLAHLAHWSSVSEPVVEEQGDDHAMAAKLGDKRLGGVTIGQILAYMDDSLCSKLTLDDLAKKANLSRASFTRSFRAALGKSPHQFLCERRIKHSKRLLRHSDLNLARIASESGFSSQSHFTGMFREQVGMTPARYRQNLGSSN